MLFQFVSVYAIYVFILFGQNNILQIVEYKLSEYLVLVIGRCELFCRCGSIIRSYWWRIISVISYLVLNFSLSFSYNI